MEHRTDEFRYDTVVFDVGGTLLGFHDRTPFRQFLVEAGLPATDEDTRELHRRLIALIVGERDTAQGLGADGAELRAWWLTMFGRAWPERPDLAEEMLRWLFAGRFDQLYDDALPALDGLLALGLRLGVVSNFGTHLPGVLENWDLARRFDFVVVSAAVGVAKPDPRIFDLAVDAAGRPRERLLYVGDHLGDDVEGARAAGMAAVLIDRGDRLEQALCPRIGSLMDLLDYVRVPHRPAPAIVFDMDGVVLDSMPDHLSSWQEALAPLGLSLTAADLYPLEGVPTEATARLLTARLGGRACTEEQARHLAAAKRAAFDRLFGGGQPPRLVSGIGPLLHDLHGRGFRLGLVTGSARRVVDTHLTAAGVAHLFSASVAGDEVEHGKPDPESYRRLAGLLGLPPGACLVVENAPLGIEAARAAGMGCVALQSTLPAGPLRAAGASQVLADGRALRTWLLARWRAPG